MKAGMKNLLRDWDHLVAVSADKKAFDALCRFAPEFREYLKMAIAFRKLPAYWQDMLAAERLIDSVGMNKRSLKRFLSVVQGACETLEDLHGTPKKDAISESTIARIAGNLRSGHVVSEPGLRDERVRFVVAQARAIAAEVERTRPEAREA